MIHASARTHPDFARRLGLLFAALLACLPAGRVQAQASGSVEIFAMVVARPSTTLTLTGGPVLQEVAGGVVLVQQMALSSNVDSQTLEATMMGGASTGGVTVSVRCGGGSGNCRLSEGDTPRIAIEVSIAGMAPSQVQAALAAPDRFAARLSYRLVRGEGT